jgi:hypothetical protein
MQPTLADPFGVTVSGVENPHANGVEGEGMTSNACHTPISLLKEQEKLVPWWDGTTLWCPPRKIYRPPGKARGMGKFGIAKAYSKYRRKLSEYLCKAWSMSRHDSRILCERPISEIKKIFENLDSLIDCLVLLEENLFERRNRRFLANLVPKILKVSTYGVDDVIRMWKDFVLHMYRCACGTEVEESKPLVSNIFARLLKEETFIRYTNGLADKRMCENLAHLISTRNLANGGPKMEKAAIDKFKELTSVVVDIDRTAVMDHTNAGQYIGDLCLYLNDGNLSNTQAHVSLCSSGSLDSEVSNGGMASEAFADIMKFTKGVPDVDEPACLRRAGVPMIIRGGPEAPPRWKKI